jgi:hypothetical protein
VKPGSKAALRAQARAYAVAKVGVACATCGGLFPTCCDRPVRELGHAIPEVDRIAYAYERGYNDAVKDLRKLIASPGTRFIANPADVMMVISAVREFTKPRRKRLSQAAFRMMIIGAQAYISIARTETMRFVKFRVMKAYQHGYMDAMRDMRKLIITNPLDVTAVREFTKPRR